MSAIISKQRSTISNSLRHHLLSLTVAISLKLSPTKRIDMFFGEYALNKAFARLSVLEG